MHNVKRERPLTHDLCKSMIVAAGRRRFGASRSRTSRTTPTIAELHLERDGSIMHVDSRPSDAIAIAIRLDAPIFAAEIVLSTPDDDDDESGREDVQPAGRVRRESSELSAEQLKAVSRAFAPRGLRQVQSVIVALSLSSHAGHTVDAPRVASTAASPAERGRRSSPLANNGSCCTASDTIAPGRSTPCARRERAFQLSLSRPATRPRSISRRRRTAASCIPRRPSARRSCRGDDAMIIVFDTTSRPVAIKLGGRHLIVGAPKRERPAADRRSLRSRKRQHRHRDREGQRLAGVERAHSGVRGRLSAQHERRARRRRDLPARLDGRSLRAAQSRHSTARIHVRAAGERVSARAFRSSDRPACSRFWCRNRPRACRGRRCARWPP